MDMAWSDNLSDCEENLLKVSTHVQNTPSSQLHDVYSILLHDRYGHYLLAVFYRTLFHTFLSIDSVSRNKGILLRGSLRFSLTLTLYSETHSLELNVTHVWLFWHVWLNKPMLSRKRYQVFY